MAIVKGAGLVMKAIIEVSWDCLQRDSSALVLDNNNHLVSV